MEPGFKGGLSLTKALRLKRRAVVSFVGAGGKTSAMFRLAEELRAAGWRVVTTTTTHIGEAQVSLAPTSLQIGKLDSLSARLDQCGHCLLIGSPDERGRMCGVSSELVADLHAHPDVDAVLVEADGARLRLFKAPAEHEPVVPAVTTHLVPVVGVDIIGRALNAECVHRPEQVSALTGLPLESPIKAEIVARVLAHSCGGAKQRPPQAQLLPLLNKADSEAGLRSARAIAERLAADPAVDAVLAGSMQRETPVREVWTRVAGIVLAAGQSSRFGAPKQLLQWGDTTLAGHAAQTAFSAGLRPVIVVTGYEAERVDGAIANLPVETAFNPQFAEGQSTSIRRGVAALPERSGAAVFLLVDQPGVTPEVIKGLIQAHRETLAPIVMPVFKGRRGNPVLFDRVLFSELKSLTGDAGGRLLFENYEAAAVRVAVDEPAVLQDIDTPESLACALRDRKSIPPLEGNLE